MNFTKQYSFPHLQHQNNDTDRTADRLDTFGNIVK